MKLYFILAVLLALPFTDACTCGVITPEQAYEKADVVFTGTVLVTWWDDNSVSVSFEIEDILKGEPLGTIVKTTGNSAACGINFEAGKRYQVYATYNAAHELITNLCSGTRLI